LPEVGMTASGVVAVQPAERVETGLVFAGPVLSALKSLAFERRVEGLGERVVRRAADRAHGLADAGLAAGVGEGPAGVLGYVIGVQDRPGEAAAGLFGGGQGVGDEVGAHVVRDRPAGQAA